ncbi:branched-chain amino acid ABC transporter substrate-binding protein [Caenispirillum bisanense]|uniref:branched-chain amino acid ABC transporter substrate-binding protein n=1 Tax=Caenispirillum bisanense TaxID=414052 RepID=UPI0031E46E2E
MSKFKITLAAAASAVALLAATGAHAEIVIATAGPMTGPYATFGEQMKMGAEMAVKDINAKGGVLGEKLVLEIGDDACDPKQAVAVANQFVNKGVKLVAGHFCSGSSIPASAVYNEEGIVQISPASTNPQLTEQGFKGVFRTCGRDDQQGLVAGEFIANNFKDKKIAIVHDKQSYSKGLADETQKALAALGITPTVTETVTPGEKDYSALVTKLKQAGVEVLYYGGYHTEAGLIVRQMREQGMNTQLISGDALVSDEFWSITGEAGAGTLMTFSPDPAKNPTAKPVVEAFEAIGYKPEGYTLYTYGAIQAWAIAAEKAGSADFEKVTAALNDGEFDTVLGTFGFDDKGDVTSPGYVFYKWENGTYKELASN